MRSHTPPVSANSAKLGARRGILHRDRRARSGAHPGAADEGALDEQAGISELNRLYQREPALHERDTGGNGLEWIVADDVENSVYAFVRHGQDIGAELLAVFNATPVPRFNYRIGLTRRGLWSEVINTDGEGFGGSNHGNFGSVDVAPVPAHGRPFSLNLTLPPLGALVLKPFV